MRLLCVGCFGLITTGGWGQKLCPIHFLDSTAGSLDRFFAQVDRVGAHVGDVAVFVEILGDAHGLARAEPQLAVGFLLQRAGGERRVGRTGGLFLFDFGDSPDPAQQLLAQRLCLLLVEQQNFFACNNLAGLLVKIAAAGDTATVYCGERGLEAVAGLVWAFVKLGLEIPVLAGHKRSALTFSQHQQTHSDTLDTACRKFGGNFAPEQRRDGVPDQAVQDSPGLLGVHQVQVDGAGLAQRLFDRLACDFMKNHAADRLFGIQYLAQMPADALPLPIFVGGQNQLVGVFEGTFELGDQLTFFVGNHIERGEVLLDIDPKP